MSSAFRRFEIRLPLKFNDGNPVPDQLIGDTLIELRDRFNASSWGTQAICGTWIHATDVFVDEHTRVFFDVPDTDENRQFFAEYKKVLKERFHQLDIWITTYPIEVL